MANTGIVTNTNEPLYSEQTIDVHAPGTATPFALNPGTIIGVDGALAGRALRAAILTGSVTATGTQQAFAHGLVNEEGNPTAPTFPAIWRKTASSSSPSEPIRRTCTSRRLRRRTTPLRYCSSTKAAQR